MGTPRALSDELPDAAQDDGFPFGNRVVEAESLKIWFESLSKAIGSEVNELKDRVIAHHEEKFRALELENRRLQSLIKVAVVGDGMSPTLSNAPPLVSARQMSPSTDPPLVTSSSKAKTSTTKMSILLDESTKDNNDVAKEKFEMTFLKNGGPRDLLNGPRDSLNDDRDFYRTESTENRTVQSIAASRKTIRKTVRPADKIQKTKKLFTRLARDEEVMSAERVYNILRIVHGEQCPMSLKTVQTTLESLCLSVRSVDRPVVFNPNRREDTPSFQKTFTKGSNTSRSVASPTRLLWGNLFRRSLSSNEYEQRCEIDCTVFLKLMEWDELYSTLAEEFAVDCYIIRDAFIKHGADLLIAHHARLDLPAFAYEKPVLIQVLEPVSAIVILLNAFTIGLSADTEWYLWDTCEVIFTIFFTLEIAIKFYYNGWRDMLFGQEKNWNYFDMLLVGLAIADILIQRISENEDLDMRDFTLARLARLAKVTRLMRLLRLLRLRIFKELLLMVRGVFAGLRTLFWAIVLLLFFVYSCSVALMQSVGEDNITIGGKYETVLFKTLLWSMFNVFRCFMSDGSLPDGTPLVGHLEARYGATFVLPYTFAKLFIVFGIFNLIAAIFVENVMASARAKRELTEDGERVRVALALRQLLLKFCGVKSVGVQRASKSPTREKISSSSRIQNRLMKHIQAKIKAFSEGDEYNLRQGHDYFEVDGVITREMFDNAIKDQETWHLLDDLEIHCDRTELFDVLDADNSGEIDIYEMISGLMKMRSGGADKSDGVATILSLRSVQNSLRTLKAQVALISKSLSNVQKHQEVLMQLSHDRELVTIEDSGSELGATKIQL